MANWKPNYSNNAKNILEMLLDTYNEAIKADFDEFYRLMNGHPLKEMDELICAGYTLCAAGWEGGIYGGSKARILTIL